MLLKNLKVSSLVPSPYHHGDILWLTDWLLMMIYSHHLSADCLMDTCSSERVSSLLPCGLLPLSLVTGPSLFFFFFFLEPSVIAKSSILLDVKPWDDETDMAKLEECVRSIQMEGLVWGQCKYSGNGLMIVVQQWWSTSPSFGWTRDDANKSEMSAQF